MFLINPILQFYSYYQEDFYHASLCAKAEVQQQQQDLLLYPESFPQFHRENGFYYVAMRIKPRTALKLNWYLYPH